MMPGAALAASRPRHSAAISSSSRTRSFPCPSRCGFFTPSIGLSVEQRAIDAQPNNFTSTERSRLAETGAVATTSNSSFAASCLVIDAALRLPHTRRAWRR